MISEYQELKNNLFYSKKIVKREQEKMETEGLKTLYYNNNPELTITNEEMFVREIEEYININIKKLTDMFYNDTLKSYQIEKREGETFKEYLDESFSFISQMLIFDYGLDPESFKNELLKKYNTEYQN